MLRFTLGDHLMSLYVVWQVLQYATRELFKAERQDLQHAITGYATIDAIACLNHVKSCSRETVLNYFNTGYSLILFVCSYRGGYTKEQRREIEQKLFGGALLGLTATSALELGIDVGGLDATLHLGVPSSQSSLVCFVMRVTPAIFSRVA